MSGKNQQQQQLMVSSGININVISQHTQNNYVFNQLLKSYSVTLHLKQKLRQTMKPEANFLKALISEAFVSCIRKDKNTTRDENHSCM